MCTHENAHSSFGSVRVCASSCVQQQLAVKILLPACEQPPKHMCAHTHIRTVCSLLTLCIWYHEESQCLSLKDSNMMMIMTMLKSGSHLVMLLLTSFRVNAELTFDSIERSLNASSETHKERPPPCCRACCPCRRPPIPEPNPTSAANPWPYKEKKSELVRPNGVKRQQSKHPDDTPQYIMWTTANPLIAIPSLWTLPSQHCWTH